LVVAWEIEITDECEGWYLGLPADDARALEAAVEMLALRGPALGRPLVDRVKGSAFHNMKELRPNAPDGRELRVLFVFDPRRVAILLLGGDKTGRWIEWYREAVTGADHLYRTHLEELHQEGELS
jgi:hypothetical protein